MTYGYNGKILKVDLSRGLVEVEEQPWSFYRRYIGCRNFGLYYLLNETKKGTDPLGPDNVLVLSTSVVTGAPIPGLSRYSAVAKSPLSGGYGEGEAGGFWGPELKFAGYDAIVITGRAAEPVYLWIHDGQAEIQPAGHLWGQDTGSAQAAIRQELGDERVRVLQIGPAGERLVRFACLLSDLKHIVGRAGLGAVMGSKNLKAVAVRGKSRPPLADKGKASALARRFSREFQENDTNANLFELGTSSYVMPNHLAGMLPTHNFRQGRFGGAELIDGERMNREMLIDHEACFSCPVRCKRMVKLTEPYEVDPQYGGPEYETLGMLGANCGVDDLAAVVKGAELCNRYGLDTISTGAMISYAMECYENGLLSDTDTDGVSLRFGNAEAMLHMIEMIIARRGLGDILAEGPYGAVARIGEASRPYMMAIKGQGLPAHEPRGKFSVAIGYAVSPTGADHLQAEHDPCFTAADSFFMKQANPLGLLEPLPVDDLSPAKVRLFAYLQMLSSTFNVLGICSFVSPTIGTFRTADFVAITEAVTGWETSLWELLKAAERSITLARCFNMREGLTRADDTLPERLFQAIEDGAWPGVKIPRDELETALSYYYGMMGWDEQTGIPRRAKLAELAVEWAIEHLPNDSNE